MPLVALQPDLSNLSDYITHLFDRDGRTLAPIRAAIEAEARTMFFDPDGAQRLLEVLLGAWLGTPDPVCPADDVAFLDWLRSRLRAYGTVLYRPRLSSTAADRAAEPPVYTLEGYDEPLPLFDADGQPTRDGGAALMELLLAGAHLVAVYDGDHAPRGTRIGNLLADFEATTLPTRKDPSNSHYLTGLAPTATTGRYLLDVDQDAPPDPCAILCAVLLGPTVNQRSGPAGDTFVQLEGWQEGTLIGGIPSPTGWHNQDYRGLYKPTLWNISTYGASAYSEKRATTVFLAAEGFDPQPAPGTIMARYAGSDTPADQARWLDRSLVRLG